MAKRHQRNPKGRPKIDPNLRRLFRTNTPAAINKLTEVALHPGYPPKIQGQALLLWFKKAYGWGGQRLQSKRKKQSTYADYLNRLADEDDLENAAAQVTVAANNNNDYAGYPNLAGV